jgi:ribosome maturation factor RimP
VGLHETIEQIVKGLGYELVEIERTGGGLLRVTIDRIWTPPGESEPLAPEAAEQFVTVEDCERVTRQLQFALEVDDIPYQRLEVSSPGIDRPLKSENDFERFVGQEIDVTLKLPMGAQAMGQVSGLRKKFRGVLEKSDTPSAWQIVWADEPKTKPGARISKKREPVPLNVLGFKLDELKEARLAPIVDFKGRQSKLQTK